MGAFEDIEVELAAIADGMVEVDGDLDTLIAGQAPAEGSISPSDAATLLNDVKAVRASVDVARSKF